MKRDLRLIVCGGRDFADWEFIYATLDYLHGGPEKTTGYPPTYTHVRLPSHV